MRTDSRSGDCNTGGCGIDGACRVHQDKTEAEIGMDRRNWNSSGGLKKQIGGEKTKK